MKSVVEVTSGSEYSSDIIREEDEFRKGHFYTYYSVVDFFIILLLLRLIWLDIK